jgi:5-methylcytosine-specific restriction endonuclease McrA
MNKWSKILTKQFLIKEYTINKKQVAKISKELNCEVSSIYKYLKKYKIPIIPRVGRTSKDYQCSFCDKWFKRIYVKKTKTGKLFCSHKCQTNYFKSRWAEAGTNSIRGKDTSVHKNCLNCNKEFKVPKSRSNDAMYCSKKCMYEYIKKTGKLKGKNCHLYIHGLGKLTCRKYGYPSNWEFLSKEIRKRDKYICQICGVSSIEDKLEVHHIDYKPVNNDHNNLITICQKCHHQIHSEIRFKKTNKEFWQLILINKMREIDKVKNRLIKFHGDELCKK